MMNQQTETRKGLVDSEHIRNKAHGARIWNCGTAEKGRQEEDTDALRRDEKVAEEAPDMDDGPDWRREHMA